MSSSLKLQHSNTGGGKVFGKQKRVHMTPCCLVALVLEDERFFFRVKVATQQCNTVITARYLGIKPRPYL